MSVEVSPEDSYECVTTAQPERLRAKPVGLKNLGNSFYANSVLQCLTYTPQLAEYCKRCHHSSICTLPKGCLFCILEGQIRRALLLPKSSKVITPSEMYSGIMTISDHFQRGRQEDAHELLRLVVEECSKVCANLLAKESSMAGSCGEEEQQSKNLEPLTAMFGGIFLSRIKCSLCKGKCDKHEVMMDLSLNFASSTNSIEEALNSFFLPEVLDGENRYQCSSCGKLRPARRKISISQAPSVLSIHLKEQERGKWYECNDERVTELSLKTVLAARTYILFYHRTKSATAGSPCKNGKALSISQGAYTLLLKLTVTDWYVKSQQLS